MWTFEPHVATQIYREMLAEAKITRREALDPHGVMNDADSTGSMA